MLKVTKNNKKHKKYFLKNQTNIIEKMVENYFLMYFESFQTILDRLKIMALKLRRKAPASNIYMSPFGNPREPYSLSIPFWGDRLPYSLPIPFGEMPPV